MSEQLTVRIDWASPAYQSEVQAALASINDVLSVWWRRNGHRRDDWPTVIVSRDDLRRMLTTVIASSVGMTLYDFIRDNNLVVIASDGEHRLAVIGRG